MKKVMFILGTLLLLFTSCENQSTTKIDSSEFNSATFLEEIRVIDSIMASGVPEKKSVKKAIVLYQDFANHFPDDPKAPDYLFRVSDFYLNSGNAQGAVDVLSGIIEKYPNYERLETAYFARASHVDLDIRDTTLAKTYYQEFLDKYPESQFAENAKNRYENVHMSIDDIIEQASKTNGAK